MIKETERQFDKYAQAAKLTSGHATNFKYLQTLL